MLDIVVMCYYIHKQPYSIIYKTKHVMLSLHDLVAFVEFKKREKHPWRSVTFSNVAGFSLQLY